MSFSKNFSFMTWFVCFVFPSVGSRRWHRRGDNYFTPDVKTHNWRIAGMQSNKQNMNVRKFNQIRRTSPYPLPPIVFKHPSQHNLVQENDKERGKGIVVIEWMKLLCYYYLLRRIMSFTVTVECTFTMPSDGIFHQTDEWTKKQYGPVSMQQ